MAQSFQVSTPAPQGQGFDMAAEQEEIARRRRLADMLRQQSAQPEGQMVSGQYVAPSITQRLASLFNAYSAGQVDRQTTGKARALAGRADERRRGETSAIVAALAGGQRGVEGMPDETGNPVVQMEPVAPDPGRAMQLAAGSSSPEAQALMPQIMGMQQQEKMAAEAREARAAQMKAEQEFRAQQLAAEQEFRREQAEAARQQRMLELQQRAEDQRRTEAQRAEDRRELLKLQNQAREDAILLAASVRQPPQDRNPVAVLDPLTGQPVFVSARDAVGRTPATGAGARRNSGEPVVPVGTNEAIREIRGLLTGTKPGPDGKPVSSGRALPTASGVGTLANSALGFVGLSTPSADTAKALEVAAGKLITIVPRFEGPQSDRDVALYKQMAGDVGNSNLPISQRLAALDQVESLFAKYERGYGAATTGEMNQAAGALPTPGQIGGGAQQMRPEDAQALQWANANPRDPRAAAIKQRLGVR